ncbi:response regulator [bacterium]|nr:response regulator [bacterium]
MSDKINIEIDESLISKLFEMTDSLAPSLKDVNLTVLKKQVYDIGLMVKALQSENEELKSDGKKKKHKRENDDSNSSASSSGSSSSYTPGNNNSNKEVDLADFAGNVSNVQRASEMAQLGIPMNYAQSTLQFIDPSAIKRDKKQYYDDNGHPVKGKVLIIDDLGIITYQLSVIFKRAGYLPITSKEIYDAVDKYKRSSFDYIIMDLFIPTEREGFILLEELKKIATSRKEDPVIAIMSASTRKDHKQECQKKGAAFYVEKLDDWQKELFGLLLQY